MFFHTYINHSSGFSNVYFSIGARYFVYSCGTEWRSLIFKIFQNLPYLFGRFENGLNVVFIVPFIFRRMEEARSFARLIL